MKNISKGKHSGQPVKFTPSGFSKNINTVYSRVVFFEKT